MEPWSAVFYWTEILLHINIPALLIKHHSIWTDHYLHFRAILKMCIHMHCFTLSFHNEAPYLTMTLAHVSHGQLMLCLSRVSSLYHSFLNSRLNVVLGISLIDMKSCCYDYIFYILIIGYRMCMLFSAFIIMLVDYHCTELRILSSCLIVMRAC